MGKLTPIFGVLGLLGFAALHACSSDDGASGGKKGGGGGGSGGDGGDAGAPPLGGSSGNTSGGGGSGATGGDRPTGGTGGTGGAAGQAGEPATGGVSGDAGMGGEGGEGAVGPGADCTTCINGGAADSARVTLLANCEDSPTCTAWMTCVRGCSDSACLDACDADNPGVAPYRYAIYGALCGACTTQCSALELCDRACTDNVNLVPTNVPPATLAATGLYASPTATPDQVAAYARPFHPKFELWSDGAVKRRWAYIPACSRINTEGINHWIFPVGTRLWKEFTVPAGSSGVTGTRVETRFLHKFAADDDTGWLFATYQWPMNNANPTAADATLVDVAGVMNANGTQHDIPARAACPQCHGSLVEKVLGFGAIQLSHNEDGVTIRSLADAGWLTFPAAAPALGGGLARNGFNPPGTATDQGALGYLHANCGNCHHAGTIFGGATPVRMRLMVGMNTLQTTDTFTSLVNVPTVRPFFNGCDRIEPGFASHSEIIMRMNRRDTPLPGQQMPPLATEVAHTEAVTRLSQWINQMTSTGAPTCTPPTN